MPTAPQGTPYNTWIENPTAYAPMMKEWGGPGEGYQRTNTPDIDQFNQDWDAGRAMYADRFNPGIAARDTQNPTLSLEQWLATNPNITTNPENDYMRSQYLIPTQHNDFMTDYGALTAMLLATAGTAAWAGGAGAGAGATGLEGMTGYDVAYGSATNASGALTGGGGSMWGTGAGTLYDTAATGLEGMTGYDVAYGSATDALGTLTPGSASMVGTGAEPGFFQQLMQQYGVKGTPGETTMQRLMRLARGGSKLHSLGSGVMGLYQANQMRQLAKPGQEAAKRMAYLEGNPEAIQGLPGYASGKAAMIQARDRLIAQQGQTGGGMALEATMKSEGAYDAQFRNAELQRLQSVAQGGVAPQINYAELVSRALASIGYGLGPQQTQRR